MPGKSTPPWHPMADTPSKRMRKDPVLEATEDAIALMDSIDPPTEALETDRPCVVNGCVVRGVDEAPAVQDLLAGGEYGDDAAGSFSVAVMIEGVDPIKRRYLNAIAIVLLLGYTHEGRWHELFARAVRLFLPEQRASLCLYVQHEIERDTVQALRQAGASYLVIEELGRTALLPHIYEDAREALLSGVAPEPAVATAVVDAIVGESPRIVLRDTPAVIRTFAQHRSPAVIVQTWYENKPEPLPLAPRTCDFSPWVTVGRLAVERLKQALEVYQQTSQAVAAVAEAHKAQIEAKVADHEAEVALQDARQEAKLWASITQQRSVRARQRELLKLRHSKQRDDDAGARRLRVCASRIREYAVLLRTWRRVQALTDETLLLLHQDEAVCARKELSTLLHSYGTSVRLLDPSDATDVTAALEMAERHMPTTVAL